MEKKIKDFVFFIIENNMENVYEKAIDFFGESPLIDDSVTTNIVIPELGDIASIKRQLVIDTVYQKTHFKIGMAPDYFSDTSIVLIDKKE